jgi:hypothetical protein
MMFTAIVALAVLGGAPQQGENSDWPAAPAVAPAFAPARRADSWPVVPAPYRHKVPPDAEGKYTYTTSKGVALERRVDASGNVQIDFPGGDPAKFSEPTVYERAKARLQAASALAPVAPVASATSAMASVAPMPPASSLGGPAQYAPAYAPAMTPAPAPLPTWQPLASSPGYEAWGTVGPDGIWRYEPGSVRPMGGWAVQGQVQPAVSYAPPAVSYAPPVYSMGGGTSACGPYGCGVSGGPVGGFGPRGGLFGFGVLGRR